MKKVIDFLKSEVVIFLVLLICAGFVGADLYKLWVLREKTRFIIPTSIILGYFLVLWLLKRLCPYYKWKRKMEDKEITITERIDIRNNKFLPEERKNMPNTIYKFICLGDNEVENEKRLSTLENNEIWFCRANKLNDPYEGCNCCYGDEFPDQNIDFFFGVKNLRDGWNEYIEKQKHNLGICSFSKHCKLMPLWAHYAGNHQGFCCEYEIIDKRDVFEVQYIAFKFEVSKDINKLVQDYDDGKITDEEYNQALYEIHKYSCAFKSLEWENEAEVRIIQRLKESEYDGERKSIDSVGLKLKSIIIGRNCRKENRIKLKEIAMKLRVPCHTARFNYDGDYPTVLLDDEKDAVAEMKEMLRR